MDLVRTRIDKRHLNVAGPPDIVVDVAVVHDFHGSVVDAERHGQLRHPNPDN